MKKLLQTTLPFITQLVINGIIVIDCPPDPFGSFTIGVDGELNGASTWEVTGGTGNMPCADYETGFFFTQSLSGFSFLFPDEPYVIRTSGGCLNEPVCFSFVPSELLGIANFSIAITSYCEDADVQTGLDGDSPAGEEVYSARVVKV